MKLTVTSIGVLATVMVLASVAGIYAISYDSGLGSFSEPSQSAMFLGNVKVTHLDENGDVIGYRHGSNHITMGGMNIIMGQVFSYKNQTYSDRGANQFNVTGRVSHMQVGFGGEQGVGNYATHLAWNNTDIQTPVGDVGGAGGVCKRIRINAPLANTSATNFPGPVDADMPHRADTLCDPRSQCAARMNFTAIASFAGDRCGGTAGTIDEAGIFTGANAVGDQMFARNTFGSVVLGAMDTLQLEWEFSFKDALP